MTVKLYGYWRSSSAYRVRIALSLKGIPHQYVAVHLLRDGGQQHESGFLTKSPLGQVPVLELVSGECFAQSMAIIEYLEEMWPEPPLLPADAPGRARARELAEMVNSGIQPLQNRFVLEELTRRGVDSAAWCRLFIERGLQALERSAERTAGRFLIGDGVTIADLYLVPQLYNARRFGIELEPFPTLVRIDAACLALEAFEKARPENQIDAEPDP